MRPAKQPSQQDRHPGRAEQVFSLILAAMLVAGFGALMPLMTPLN